MKKLGYYFFKYWIATALFFYYRKFEVFGLDNVPKNKPVLFLSNHQNALLDILLIATRCNRKPWYLTRADVFKSKLFRPLFSFLQMLPVYRIRDGKANLSKNKEIFDTCAKLLDDGEAILLFPEANHNLKRRVRPLSKGFTRIIDAALQLNPDMDLQLVPVGQNYKSPTMAGDSTVIYYGKPIAVQDFNDEDDFVGTIKKAVFNELTQLTTHIPSEESYEAHITQLKAANIDFTKPKEVNLLLNQGDFDSSSLGTKRPSLRIGRLLFRLLNLPLVFLWGVKLKPKVPEPEFEGTFRFGFALLTYPIFYILSFVVLSAFYNIKTACLIVIGHAVVNLLLVKWGITSSPRRK